MTMTKQDYIVIAEGIRSMLYELEEEGIHLRRGDAMTRLIRRLAMRLKQDNPRFSFLTFMTACSPHGHLFMEPYEIEANMIEKEEQ